MKRIFIIISILSAFTGIAKAQGNFGLGIIVGEPTGISIKAKLSGSSAIDAALGWSFAKYSSMHIHADYLNTIAKLGSQVPLYIGIGGRLKANNGDRKEDSHLGVRVPFGIDYTPPSTPVELFFEVVPIMDLTPTTDFTWNAAAGVRYYFQ